MPNPEVSILTFGVALGGYLVLLLDIVGKHVQQRQERKDRTASQPVQTTSVD